MTLPRPGGGRKDYTLGRYGSPESKAEYRRILAVLDANGGRLTDESDERSINEVLLAFYRHAEKHYRHPDGSPTSELLNVRLSLRPVKELFGHTVAADFGPLSLKIVRDAMVKSKLSRRVVNQRISRVKMAFSWKGLLRQLNRVKKAGEPESKRVSAERLASQAEEMYRKRVRWWGG